MTVRLLKQESGAAAAEMALVAPLLIILMLGSMELGHYFYSEHVVVKAVRDGARFAARQSFGDYTCGPDTVSDDVIEKTQKLTRTNTIDGTGNPRLGLWTQDSSVSVTPNCFDNSSGNYTTLYGDGVSRVPRVTVSAIVPYTSLFGAIGFKSTGLHLKASSEAVVMGI